MVQVWYVRDVTEDWQHSYGVCYGNQQVSLDEGQVAGEVRPVEGGQLSGHLSYYEVLQHLKHGSSCIPGFHTAYVSHNSPRELSHDPTRTMRFSMTTVLWLVVTIISSFHPSHDNCIFISCDNHLIISSVT